MDPNKPLVQFDTSMGSFTLELDAAKAPKTVANFVEYVNANFFAGLTFHRVIPGFMAQGGGLDLAGRQKATRASIQNEADNGLKNTRGTVAMARTSDPHSATGQFFVNVVDNGFLDHKSKTPDGWGYCVFGKVTAGMDVIDAIVAVPTRPGDVPVKPIVIAKAKVV